MSYGLPYKGSKNLLATKIMERIPSAPVFVDLFCGGCAIAHAALLSGRFGKVIINDIEGDVSRLFVDAVNGRFKSETRWVSREDFFRLREIDPYVRYCWSFGNNGRTYLYSKEIEPYKRAIHYAVFFGDFTELRRLCPLVADAVETALEGIESRKERRVLIGKAIVARLKAVATPEDLKGNPLYGQIKLKGGGVVRLQSPERLQSLQSLQSLESLERLQSLERLERLQSLESLERLQRLQRLESLQSPERLESPESLERLNIDYRDVPLPEDCVVYCDPPYANTEQYGIEISRFDSDAFWAWARDCKRPLFISEYNAPDDFVPIAEFAHRARASRNKNNAVTERLFVHKTQYDDLNTALF